jgi:hypothetical protein
MMNGYNFYFYIGQDTQDSWDILDSRFADGTWIKQSASQKKAIYFSPSPVFSRNEQ